MISLVQLDSLTPRAFGKDVSEIRTFAENIIQPFCGILILWYHEDLLSRLIQRI